MGLIKYIMLNTIFKVSLAFRDIIRWKGTFEISMMMGNNLLGQIEEREEEEDRKEEKGEEREREEEEREREEEEEGKGRSI